MAEVLQQTVNGLALSSTYILIAVGLTLVMGVSRVMNYAQGQLVVLGSFIGYAAVSSGLPWWLGLLLAPLAVGLVGLALRGAVFNRISHDYLAMFIVTVGIGIVIEQLLVEGWGAKQRQIDSPLTSSVEFLGVVITSGRLFMIACCIPVLVGLIWLIGHTGFGRGMRATAEDREVSELVGVNAGRSQATSFMVGSALAGLAGVLLGIVFPFTPFSGGSLLIKGLAVALAGGAGNITGAIIVGAVLGLVEAFGSAYGVPLGFTTLGAEWQDGYAYVLLIALLAWRPGGLMRGTGAL